MRAARVLLLASMSLVIAAATASCTGQRVRGSGKVVTKDVAVSSFTRLQASWGFAVTVADPPAGPAGGRRAPGGAVGRLPPGRTVDARSATTTVSGASQVELSGRAGTLNASASGASHLLLQQLQVDALAVSLSGASNADVAVRRTISASLSGASSTPSHAGDPRWRLTRWRPGPTVPTRPAHVPPTERSRP